MSASIEKRLLLERLVAEAIARHDPLGLHALGAPPNEYEPQARAVAAAIARCHSAEACLDLVWDVFGESFGESAAPKERFARLANDIFEIRSLQR